MKKVGKRILSVMMAGCMTIGSAAASTAALPVYAGTAESTQKTAKKKETKKAKYISDVFIAYGKTESEAVKYLTDHDWEPLTGHRDFNAGKNSSNNKAVAAVMGIRRTDSAKEAITDMAVMNMTGSYSFAQYEDLLDEKRDEIDEFIYSFLPAIEEFRANYNGEGSEAGQQRAQLAYELMNKFFDGGDKEKYRKNDTGQFLGDLFLEPLIQEGAGEGSGDLEQIILEGSAPAVMAVERALALSADTGEDSWMERMEYLTMDELTENLGSYIPDVDGMDVAPSAAMNYLQLEYGDTAETLAEQWDSVHEQIIWYEEFVKEHDLEMHEDESEEEYKSRYSETMDELKEEEKKDPVNLEQYLDVSFLKQGIETVSYPGEWGETLYDFFNPAGDSSYSYETESYLPMAAALSEGQRSAISIFPLELLLKLGASNGEADVDLFEDTDELLDGCESISVYSGVNRGIFRDGVALTSEAEIEDNKGVNPAMCYDSSGLYKALSTGAIVTGCILVAAGGIVLAYTLKTTKATGWVKNISKNQKNIEELTNSITKYNVNKNYLTSAIQSLEEKKAGLENGIIQSAAGDNPSLSLTSLADVYNNKINIDNYNTINDINIGLRQSKLRLQGIENELKDAHKNYGTELKESQNIVEDTYRQSNTRSSRIKLGIVLAGIGAVILTIGIIAKICETHDTYEAYHNKEFTRIPSMIVDKKDIVTYVEKDGEMKKIIEFDQYAYYEAVRCNRQDVGELGKWQKGVSEYKAWGCGDIADLNADQGREWLALYTAKAYEKGAQPVLADSLNLAYGENSKPDLDTPSLHWFANEGRVDLAEIAFCYTNYTGKMFFTWNTAKAA